MNNEILQDYKMMLFIRKFEEQAAKLYGLKKIGGFCHLCSGQEATSVGIVSAKKECDAIITAYRAHGIMLAVGSDPYGVMAELTGKRSGCSKGKGGSMHMFNLEKNFYGGHGIVGAQVSIGTGIAFANKYKKNNAMCFTLMGDGASNQGQVYESFNMASLWNLPIVYIIENNMYAMGTSVQRACANTDLYKRGEAFDIRGFVADGMDLFDVKDKVKQAVQHYRESNKPSLIEIKTYRYRGHSMSDPAKYRTSEEVANYKGENDPINRVKKYLLENTITNEDEIREIEKRVKQDIKKIVEFAISEPEPEEAELYEDIL